MTDDLDWRMEWKDLDWREEWKAAARDLGLDYEPYGNQYVQGFVLLSGTVRGVAVEVNGGQSVDQAGKAHASTTYQVGSHDGSLMAGWKFRMRSEPDRLVAVRRGVAVELPPPAGPNPVGAFLGASNDLLRVVVVGKDRKRFVEHLTDDRKAALSSLFATANPDIKNGTIRCRYSRIEADSTRLVRIVSDLVETATILSR